MEDEYGKSNRGSVLMLPGARTQRKNGRRITIPASALLCSRVFYYRLGASRTGMRVSRWRCASDELPAHSRCSDSKAP